MGGSRGRGGGDLRERRPVLIFLCLTSLASLLTPSSPAESKDLHCSFRSVNAARNKADRGDSFHRRDVPGTRRHGGFFPAAALNGKALGFSTPGRAREEKESKDTRNPR